jgi:hypothetical protein
MEWSRILAYIIGTVNPIEGCRAFGQIRYLLHDRDTKYTASFLAIIGMKTLRLRALSPNLNAYSERWVRSAKEECLSKLVLFGERSSLCCSGNNGIESDRTALRILEPSEHDF